MNKAALKLPDPLLVRYYREQRIDRIVRVREEKGTRKITVTLEDKSVERWSYLADLGWIPAEN